MSRTAERIYLDNAATSWPKPESVYRAVDHYQRQVGAPAGRSAYQQAEQVRRHLQRLRQQILQLVGAAEQQYVAVFAASGTDALNTVLHGILAPGDHVVTTQAEHNSVLRPLRALSERKQIEVTRVAVDAAGRVELGDIEQVLRPDTRMIVLTHASNVTGTVQPVEQVCQLGRQHQVLTVLDAAQTLGRWPIDVASLGVDALAAPGHKGLLGPLGTGVLVVRRQLAAQLQPNRQGGTGSQSESDRQPDDLPDRLEAGNQNVPGLFGLQAGLEYVIQQGVPQIADHEQQLLGWLEQQLGELPAVRLYAADRPGPRVGVLSLTMDGYDPQELAAVLDATASIQVRSGLHCAPLIHRALGTAGCGGTVRLSLGPFNSQPQLEVVRKTFQALAGAHVR